MIQGLKQEISTINSKLVDEQRKNFKINDMLELRSQYITQLQEVDEINKAHIILQMKDNEDLRVKVDKAKKFKAEVNELINKLRDDEKMVALKNDQLTRDLMKKDEKLAKYKTKLNAVRTP